MKNLSLFYLSIALASLLGGCASSNIVPAPKQNIGLRSFSALSEKPIVINADTPVLKYNNRLYYFHDSAELKTFRDMPEVYVMKYTFNELPTIAKPLESDYGLRSFCSVSGEPIVISQFTPAATHIGRVYYFAHAQSRDMFIQDPQGYTAKFPANQAPKIIAPLKSQYGSKAICAATGAPLLVGPHTPALEYIGRVFYFSDLSAMETFQRDPQSLITKPFNRENSAI